MLDKLRGRPGCHVIASESSIQITGKRPKDGFLFGAHTFGSGLEPFQARSCCIPHNQTLNPNPMKHDKHFKMVRTPCLLKGDRQPIPRP